MRGGKKFDEIRVRAEKTSKNFLQFYVISCREKVVLVGDFLKYQAVWEENLFVSNLIFCRSRIFDE